MGFYEHRSKICVCVCVCKYVVGAYASRFLCESVRDENYFISIV